MNAVTSNMEMKQYIKLAQAFISLFNLFIVYKIFNVP